MIISRDKGFYKSLIALAVPISLQNMITFSVGFADNIMIGSLGDTAVSAVYMGNQLQTVFQLFTLGIEGALLILAAQYWGKRNTENIKKLIAIAIKLALFFGLIFTFVSVLFPKQVINIFTTDVSVINSGAQYLQILGFSYMFFAMSSTLIASMRSVESAKVGLYISCMTLAVDVGLNYLLIFGVSGYIPALGVRGAATATLISRICEAVAMIIYVRFIDKKLLIRFKELIKTDMLMLKDFIKYGLPVLGGQIVWACNNLAYSMILGRFSASVITATSMTGMLNSLVYVWMSGLSSAVGIITGKTVGLGLYEKVKEYAKTVQLIFLGVGIFSGLFVWFMKTPFISLYDVSADAKIYAFQFMTVISITLIGSCYQATCLSGLVKSAGDISFVFKNDTVFVFLVVIPSALIACYLNAPVWVVFACLKCDQILKCFVAVVKINKYNWIKNLTRE